MKCNIHTVDDIEEYEKEMDKHQRDPGIFPVPEMNVKYSLYNIPDEFIIGYRMLDENESKNGKLCIYIMTDLHEMPFFVIDYTEEEQNYLDDLINIRNKQFRNL